MTLATSWGVGGGRNLGVTQLKKQGPGMRWIMWRVMLVCPLGLACILPSIAPAPAPAPAAPRWPRALFMLGVADAVVGLDASCVPLFDLCDSPHSPTLAS
jgi:hypothetical protein